jgi:hypothetical protein
MRFSFPPIRDLLFCAAAAVALGRPARAQSLTNGALRGVVMHATDATPITGVQITVEGADGRAILFLESDGAGTFGVPLLAPGIYRVLAEQVGLQSMRVTGVVVAAGQTTAVSFRLDRKPPPVERVVEVNLAGTSAGPTLGHTVSGRPLTTGDRFRPASDISRDLTDVVRTGDGREGWALSSGGLPATASRLWVDGLPEIMARHPALSGEPAAAPLFQRDALTQAQLIGAGFDAEWRGYPGALLAAHTTRGGNQMTFRPYGTLSSASLGADAKDNPADSTGTSFQVGASLSGPIVRDTAHFALRLDFQQLRTPSPYPWENDAATYQGANVSLRETIGHIAQDSFGVAVGSAVAPTVRSWRGFSSLGRVDWQLGRHTVMLRFGYSNRTEKAPFLLDERSNLSGAEVESNDLSGAISFTTAWENSANELRFGVSSSKRDWTEGTLPATSLVTEGIAFGGSAAVPGNFDTQALDLSDALQFKISRHRLKLGFNYTLFDYEQDYRYGSAGVFTFGGLDQFGGGEGTFYQSVAAGSQTAAPRVNSGGVFLQDTWTASPEISLLLGLRYDKQNAPDNDIQLNQEWLELSGLANNVVPDDNKGWGPRLGFVWDVQSRGDWIVRGGAGLFAGGLDPSLFAEAVLFDGGVTVRRGQGLFPSWPSAPDGQLAPNVGPRLTLFSDTYRNPRTFKTGFDISRTFHDGVALHVGGAYHHTDFLARRVDLNLNTVPTGETQEGRPIYGNLVQQGGLISAAPESNRRFDGFDLVSGLEPTGFADYYEAGVILEHQRPAGVSYSLAYTFSRTTDNVIGRRTLDPADQLNPFPESLDGADWTDGRSDFDVPHRVALSAEYRGGVKTPFSIGARWRFRSGLPFTPGFRPGVDVNGDGAGGNDPAFLDPGQAGLSEALTSAGCSSSTNEFAERNSCREDAAQALDLRASVALPVKAPDGSRLSLVLDAFNVVSSAIGIVDRAVLLVDPNGQLTVDAQGNVTLPLVVNSNFGTLISRRNDPRLFRIGLRMEY